MQTDRDRVSRSPLLVRVVRARPRLFSSATLGIAVSLALAVTTDWLPATRWLVGWDVGVAVYLVLAFEMMASSDIQRIRRRAGAQDEGQFVILALTVAAALASLVAIIAELGTSAGGTRPTGHLAVATLTILLSWAFIHTIFALHYAHEFYDDNEAGGMAFPGGETDPDYWDFVYFSFVIGMTSQVSDVGITSKEIRRTTTAHGIISFLFNAALLALTVNIAASAI